MGNGYDDNGSYYDDNVSANDYKGDDGQYIAQSGHGIWERTQTVGCAACWL